MIAILADIHANLPALEAVLRDTPRLTGLWVLGDAFGELLYPCEVMERLLSLSREIPVHCVAGNREISLLEARAGKHPGWWHGTQYRPLAWTCDRLKPEHWAELSRWPTARALGNDAAPGGALLFHGTPEAVRGIVYFPEQAEAAARGRTERWLVGGHTHRTLLHPMGERLWINPGSVGVPLEGVGGVACYALLDENRRPGDAGCVTLRKIPYDVETLIGDLARSELAELAPGITRALIAELRTGVHHMAALVKFCAEYAQRALGHEVTDIPPALWHEAEALWDGAPWQGELPR